MNHYSHDPRVLICWCIPIDGMKKKRVALWVAGTSHSDPLLHCKYTCVPPMNCGFPTSCGYQWIMDDHDTKAQNSRRLHFMSPAKVSSADPLAPAVSRGNSQLQCTFWTVPDFKMIQVRFPVELLLNMLYSNVYIYIYTLLYIKLYRYTYIYIYICIQITTWNATQTGWAIAWSLLADCPGWTLGIHIQLTLQFTACFRGEVSKEFPRASNFWNPEIYWFSHRNKCQNLWMFNDVHLRKYGEIMFSGLFRSYIFQARRVRVPESAHNIFSQWHVYQPL